MKSEYKILIESFRIDCLKFADYLRSNQKTNCKSVNPILKTIYKLLNKVFSLFENTSNYIQKKTYYSQFNFLLTLFNRNMEITS